MIRVAIVEDDISEQYKLQEYLTKIENESNSKIVFTVQTFSDGLDFLDKFNVGFDIIFLDIEMPYLNGVETAKRLRKFDSVAQVIFITNFGQMALSGYEVEALDFIIKPVSFYRFETAVKKAVQRIEAKGSEALMINLPERTKRCIALSDIIYIEVRGHKLTFHLINDTIEIRSSLNEIKSNLPAEQFVYCNSCYLVNLKYVQGIEGDMLIFRGESIPISRSKRKEFTDKLTYYLRIRLWNK